MKIHSRSKLLALWGGPCLPALLLSVLSCSLAVDAGREQCSTDDDCTGRGFSENVCVDTLCRPRPDPAWACLEDDARASVAPPNQVRVIVPLVDVITNQAVPGVQLSACARLDGECGMPVASATSNDAGEVDLRLPGGFNGYFRWQGENVYPTMYFIGAPLLADAIFPVNVITPQVLAGLNAQFQDRAVEGRTAVVVFARNCDNALAAGVSVSVPEGDGATRPLYEVDGVFPASQTDTSAAGLVRVNNVPVGSVSIVGHLGDGREMGRASILTRRDFAILTNLRPNAF